MHSQARPGEDGLNHNHIVIVCSIVAIISSSSCIYNEKRVYSLYNFVELVQEKSK